MSISGSGAADSGSRAGLFDHAGLKVLALFFAVVLWFFVVGEESSEVGLMVQLGLKGIPDEMIVTKTPALDIEVRVAGPGGFLEKLSPSDVAVALDLSSAKAGDNTYRITPVNAKVPTGIRVLTVRPSSVEIRLERLTKKTMIVKPRTKGVAAKGFKVVSVKVEPESVEVLGRKHVMRKVRTISTEPFDISGLDRNTTQSVHLDLSKKGLSGAEPSSVTVKVVIEKLPVRKGR